MSATQLLYLATSGYWPNTPPLRGSQQFALALLWGWLAQPSDMGTGQAKFSPGLPVAFAWQAYLALRPLGSAFRYGSSPGQVSAAQARHSPSLGLALIAPAMACSDHWPHHSACTTRALRVQHIPPSQEVGCQKIACLLSDFSRVDARVLTFDKVLE